MKCLILASGFGTRLYPLTLNQAKPLLPYKGKPMINHVLDKIPPDIEVLVNINKKFEADFVAWSKQQIRDITLCVEEIYTDEEKLGAVGALNYWIIQKGIREDLMVMGSDNYFEFDISHFIHAYNGENVIVAVHDIGDLRKATQYGVVKLNGNKIVELEEKPVAPQSSLVSTACYIIPPRVFWIIAEYCLSTRRDNLGSFISYLLEKDTVYAFAFKETWIDIGNLEIYHHTR